MRARKKGDGSFRKLKTGQIELTISDGYDIFGKDYVTDSTALRNQNAVRSTKSLSRVAENQSEQPTTIRCQNGFLCGWTHTRKTTYSEARLKNISISYKK